MEFFDNDEGLARVYHELSLSSELLGFDIKQDLVDNNYNGAPPVYEENK